MKLDTAMHHFANQIVADPPATLVGMVELLGGTSHVAGMLINPRTNKPYTARTVERWIAKETGSAKQQRGISARDRAELEKLATDKVKDEHGGNVRTRSEARADIMANGLSVHFEGVIRISNKTETREINTRIASDTIENFEERIDSWLDALLGHHWMDAVDGFDDMFFEAFTEDPGLAERGHIVDIDEMDVPGFTS